VNEALTASNGDGAAGDAYIGVDVGGTHTDVAAVIGGRTERGKALTTYGDFSEGVLAATGVAAQNHGLSLAELLGRTRLFINGTTVVTNTITTLKGGARVGAIVTAGFKDTFRFAGGPRQALYDDHLQVNAPDIVARTAIAEVRERVKWSGEQLCALDREQLAAETKRLVEDEGVEAIAVCFLSSFANPVHELEALDIITDLYPDLFVSLSHKVFPVAGENRRWTTAVLNCFVHKSARRYLDSLSSSLRAAGLRGGLVFAQGLGGGISLERAREFPLALLGSGPAGGAVGANALARRMGASNVVIADMGGTSLDTGIICDNEIRIEKNLQLGLLHTGVNVVDVVSVGAGGGSVASLGDRGVPRVGPESAGSEPGPAAYGKGGERPTVTDAMVLMGFIDPERYLGGRFELRPELARRAVEDFARNFSWTTEEAAAAVHDLVVVNMAHAVREVSVAKGHDPRGFVFLAYGGTLPLFAVQIAEQLGVSSVVIPRNSSVFSAAGLLATDFVVRYDQTVSWDLSRLDDIGRVNAIADALVERARAELTAEGFAPEEIEISRSGDFRFLGQAYELAMRLPQRALRAQDAPELAEQFFGLYEKTYGEGTAWKGVPEMLVNYTVTATGRQARPELEAAALAPRGPEEIRSATRAVYLPSLRERREVPIYLDSRFSPGSSVEGPAIIDATDTTVYVPPNTTARRDEFLNYVLTSNGAAR
jgi:N-methylhydantoinase A